MAIYVEAKLVCLTSNPHDESAGWEAKFCVEKPECSTWDPGRVFTFSVPLSLKDALLLGPHIGQDVAIGIAVQYQPGTIQEMVEAKQ